MSSILNWEIKAFKELSKDDLYTIIQLRVEVFVIKQDCPYQDLDGYDQKALHLIGRDNGKIVCYSRLFGPDIKYKNNCAIGRVVCASTHRNNQFGRKMMQIAVQFLSIKFAKHSITISAQTHLENFYQGIGFSSTEKKYLEDNIPHLEMIFKN